MMTSPDVELTGVQEPTLLHLPRDVHSLAAADEALELLDQVRTSPLDDAQRIALRTALGERDDGTWAAFEVGIVEPRQNGKGDILEGREVAGLFLFGEQLLIHTAHEFPTANEAFLRMVALVESHRELESKVMRIRFANGEQGIELKSGARLKYRARTGGAGRGFAGADLVVYDEAYALKAEHIAASLPTLSTGVNPQVWYASSAGLADSSALWALRKRALAGAGGRLAYVEHTAEDVSLDESGRVVSVPIDVSDRRLVAKANPAYGTRISVDYIEAEHAAMGDAKFARERLGVWDPLAADVEAAPVKIPADAWLATVVPERAPAAGRMAIGWAVSRDGEWSSIALGDGTIADPYVVVVEHRRGVGWLPQRLVELVERWDPIVVGWNNAGAAAAQSGAVLEAFRVAGVDTGLLSPVNTQDYKAACGGFFTDVVEGRLSRPDGQGPLDVAVGEASERVLGDAWAWDVRNATVPISPLEAVTVARFLLPTEVPVAAPVFAY